MLKVIQESNTFVRKTRQHVVTDGLIFRLQTILTTVFLFSCSAIIIAKQYFGSPINCAGGTVLSRDAINNYCWTTSTYTIRPTLTAEQVYSVATATEANNAVRKYHTYYQWVSLALFLQGLLSYLPKWLWNNIENDLVAKLVAGMTQHHLKVEDGEVLKERLLNYLIGHIKLHRLYAMKYWGCELLSLLNVMCQMRAINIFFDGQFDYYGLHVFRILRTDNPVDRVDPLIIIFPRMIKCIYGKYGPSGLVQRHDAICVLSLNVINEKVYILLWYWLVISVVCLTMSVVYRSMLITSPSIRPKLIRRNKRIGKNIAEEQVEILCQKMNFGDWWVLHMLSDNLNDLLYRDILVELAQKLYHCRGGKNQVVELQLESV